MIRRIFRTILGLAIAAMLVIGAGKIISFHASRAAEMKSGAASYIAPVLSISYSPAASQNLSPTSPAWDRLPATSIKLSAQVLVIPWGLGTTPSVKVTAIHDDKKLAIRLSWHDETRNDKLVLNTDHPDGAAIMFPIGKGTPSSIMMGFLQPANIWHWKAARRYEGFAKPYIDYYNPNEKGTLLATHRDDLSAHKEGSDIIDNIATMPGTLTPKDVQQVSGHGTWLRGRWFVTFSRDLATGGEKDTQFDTAAGVATAFAIWNGEKLERGSRKSISDWVELKFMPREGVRR